MPFYLDFVKEAIENAETTPISRYKIKQYVERNIEGRQYLPHCLSKALIKGVEDGVIIQIKQSFKFSKETKKIKDRIDLYLNHIISIIKALDEDYSSRAAIKKYFITNKYVKNFDNDHFTKAISLGLEQNMIIKASKRSQSFQVVNKKYHKSCSKSPIKTHMKTKFKPMSTPIPFSPKVSSGTNNESSDSDSELDDPNDPDYVQTYFKKKTHPIPYCLQQDLDPKQVNTASSFNILKTSMNNAHIANKLTPECKVDLKTFINVALSLAKKCKLGVNLLPVIKLIDHNVTDELLRHNIIKKNNDTILIFPSYEQYIRKITKFINYHAHEKMLVILWDIIDKHDGLATISIIMQDFPYGLDSLKINIDIMRAVTLKEGIIRYGDMYSRDILMLMQHKLQKKSHNLNKIDNHMFMIGKDLHNELDFRPSKEYEFVDCWAKFQQTAIILLNKINDCEQENKHVIIDLFMFFLVNKLYLKPHELNFIKNQIINYKLSSYFSMNEYDYYSQIIETFPEKNELIFTSKLIIMSTKINSLSSNTCKIETGIMFKFIEINKQYLNNSLKKLLMAKLQLFGQQVFTHDDYQRYEQLFM